MHWWFVRDAPKSGLWSAHVYVVYMLYSWRFIAKFGYWTYLIWTKIFSVFLKQSVNWIERGSVRTTVPDVSKITDGPRVLFCKFIFEPIVPFSVLLIIRGQTGLSVLISWRWHWTNIVLNLWKYPFIFCRTGCSIYLAMHHGHHWVHLLRESHIKFASESFHCLLKPILGIMFSWT